ncbi:MAG: germination protein YpeB [Alicyclobacillaceae bacterium]|nr:germination protein YpeB [Alicyclobacillaceae bacterium]
MLHRTIWIAIPVLALVVGGAGLGWWGYDQHQQRQALALHAENQYSSAFHGLVSDMYHVEETLGKSLITRDPSAFQGRLRDVWRLSYAAQMDIGRLPSGLTPMNNVQKFFTNLGNTADRWMQTAASPTDPAVHRKLESMYQKSLELSDQLSNLQWKVLNDRLNLLSTDGAEAQPADNQIVDSFRKMDREASNFEESDQTPTSALKGGTTALSHEDPVTARQAVSAVAEFLGVARNQPWSVTQTKKGAYVPQYQVSGNTPWGPLYATVTKHGGHVVSFRIEHRPGAGEFDFGDAQDRAQRWLESRGFGRVEPLSASQYDKVGYFIYAPLYDGVPVVSQPLSVRVGLDNGHVIGYDSSQYFYYPIRSLPSRRFTVAQLRDRLSPDFRVRMEKPVVVLDGDNQYQPAVAFYGTNNDQTYCVYMNAHTGREIEIERLTGR